MSNCLETVNESMGGKLDAFSRCKTTLEMFSDMPRMCTNSCIVEPIHMHKMHAQKLLTRGRKVSTTNRSNDKVDLNSENNKISKVLPPDEGQNHR